MKLIEFLIEGKNDELRATMDNCIYASKFGCLFIFSSMHTAQEDYQTT